VGITLARFEINNDGPAENVFLNTASCKICS
jgi:hypothetical protein